MTGAGGIAFTAFAADARLVLDHRAMATGENEIVAARALLGCLDLGGTPVTADAIHCRRDTAAAVLERGGNYPFSLKAKPKRKRAGWSDAFARSILAHMR